MKKSILTLASITLGLIPANAQQDQPPAPGGSWNPYLIQGFVSPAPMLPKEFNGTGSLTFDVGNTGSDDIVWVAGQSMVLTISLSYGVPDVADPMDAITAVSGPGAAWFSWEYFPDDHTFRGTQHATIPANSRETVHIAYKVDRNAFFPAFQNGFNVNIAPPGYTNPQPTDDDTVSAYTYVEAFDYGDAPSSYGEVRHEINLRRDATGKYLAYMYLGQSVDPEAAYQASTTATGDDANPTGFPPTNDEDGVVFPPMNPGTTVHVPITITLWDFNPESPAAQATLRGWIDWNKNGTFATTSERIVNLNIAALLEEEPAWTGPRSFVFNVPVTVPANATGNYFARFRFGQPVAPNQLEASHGEVEDYRFTIPGSILTYAEWVADELVGETLTAPHEDPDGDGMENIFEFIYGTSPTQPNAPIRPVFSIVEASGSQYIQLSVPRLTNRQATVVVQVSENLTEWFSGPSHTFEVLNTSTSLVVRDLTPIAPPAKRRFIRVCASVP